MKRNIIIFILLCLFCGNHISAESYAFRVVLKSKGTDVGMLNHPERFLSHRAIQRRTRMQIPIKENDLPISHSIIDSLTATGMRLVTQSKWFGSAVLMSEDSADIFRLREMPFVSSVAWIWKGDMKAIADSTMLSQTDDKLFTSDRPVDDVYGYSEEQIDMLKGDLLHKAGFRGKGVEIAVIDAGFRNVDRLAVFDSMRLAGTCNIISPKRSVFVGDDHGTRVLSCLAANQPGILVGTAPEASYWLIKSEDSRSEYPIEEDYWTAAAEFADSVGVDVISSSLGYYKFDDETQPYTHDDLNGQTAIISRAAETAVEKGIWVISSAGNEGNGTWDMITFPGDANNVLTVAAVTKKKKRSNFSSFGWKKDGRIKPDIAALGTDCAVIDPSGTVRYANGTSFSTPIIAGLAACLRQALPDLTVEELNQLMRQSANEHKHPNISVGYGLPNVYKAYNAGLKSERNNI